MCPWSSLLDEVLELCPGQLDGVEFRKIGWKKEDRCPLALDEVSDGFGLVCLEVVHDHDVATPKMRTEEMLDKGFEGLASCPASNGHDGLHSVHSNGTNHCVQPTALNRTSLVQSLPFLRPSIQGRHCAVGGRLVDEDEVFGRKSFGSLKVRFSPSLNALLPLFYCIERLF